MAVTAAPGIIWLGTIAKITCFGIMYICAKFHAFTTKCTIFLESAGLIDQFHDTCMYSLGIDAAGLV